jgi:archaeal type IV pilus assembly protein PilA
MRRRKYNDNAVSPVVGVMLMLVVTIIIAAIVSGVAGGMVSGQKKVPQATIQATFSQTSGMAITHQGGDPLATANILFTVSANPEFGQGLGSVTTQVLNKSIIIDASGNQLMNTTDGTSNVSAFRAGDTLYINTANLDPQFFQPVICPCDGSSYSGTHGNSSYACTGSNNIYAVYWTGNGWNYDGKKSAFWNLDFVNPNNAGKSFSLTVADKAGNLISRTDVTIAP